MQAMRRYVHKIMAALLCMCLLISYMPLPASAQPAGGASVGEDGPAQMTGPYEAQASTTVSVLTVQGLQIVGKTDDFAATRQQIAAGGETYNLKVEAVGQSPLTYTWSRTVDGAADSAFSHTAQDDGTYPLSQHTDTLEDGKVYVYTVQVSDGEHSVSASIKVTVAKGYGVRTETVGDVTVAAEMHWQAVLSASALGTTSPTYAALQAQADGKTMAGAWQVALTGAPEGLAPFNGQATVTLSAGDIPADTEVSVVHMSSDGSLSTQAATVQGGKVTFTTATLGAFALAWAKPEAPLHTITATAGLGGSITPAGEVKVAQGGTVAFSVLADKGYAVERVLVDDQAVEAPGGQYVFSGVQANHTITAEFRPVTPTVQKRQVTAVVEGGHGKVALNGATFSANAKTEVAHGTAVRVNMMADAGYAVDAVTVNSGNGPVAVPVFGDVYTLAAVEADTEVKVTFKTGVQPPLPQFTITATAAEGGSVTPASSKVPLGGSASFVVVADEGYRLSGLTFEGVDVKGTMIGSTVVVENIVADGVLAAQFEQVGEVQRFQIVASASSGGTMSPNGQVNVWESDSATFEFRADEGCELVKVVVDGSDVPADEVAGGKYTFNNVSANHTIHAEFKIIPAEPIEPTYAVVHASAGPGGSISPAGDVRVVIDESYTFALLPDEGYVLDQVLVNSEDKTGSVSNSCLTVGPVNADDNMSVSATFKKNEDPDPTPLPTTHSVFATSTTGGTISPRGTTQVVEGGSATYMFAADEGYELARVEVDDVAVEPTPAASYTLSDVKADHRVHAVFERIEGGPAPEDPPYVNVDVEVKVNVSTGDTGALGGVVAPTSLSVPYGEESGRFYVYPKEGFTLEAITVNGRQVEAHPVDPSKVPVEKRDDAEFSLRALAAVFTQSTVELARAYWFVIDEAKADALIEVTFRPLTGGETLPPEEVVTHRVTVAAGAGGCINPSEMVLPQGAFQKFTIQPDKGFELAALEATIDGKPSDVTEQVHNNVFTCTKVDSDIQLRATFRQKTPQLPYVIVHATAGENGSISPAGDVQVDRTGNQEFKISPKNADFELDQVILNGEVLTDFKGDTYTVSKPTADTTLHATFRQAPVDPDPVKKFDITASATAGGTITPPGTTKVESGSNITFTLTPNKDYKLVGVQLDGSAAPETEWKSGTYTLTNVTADHTVSATFQKATIDPDPTPDPGPDPTPDPDPDPDPSPDPGPDPGPDPSPDKVTVSASAGEHGSISPAGKIVVDQGSDVVFAFTPDEGYEPDVLFVNGKNTVFAGTTYKLLSVKAETTVHVTFRAIDDPLPPKPEPTLFVVDASVSGGHGSISPAGQVRVEQGKTQTFYFLPDEGYAVSALIIDGQQQSYRASSYQMEGVQANHTLAVKFAAAVPPAPSNPIDSVNRGWQQTTNFVKTGDANGALALVAFTCAAAAAACALFARRRAEEAARGAGRPVARDVVKRGNQS